jgi:thioredoxin-dependent peroxiredoxin
VILGISYDTPEENRAFAEAQSFPYRLLSDPDRRVSEAYGASKGPDEQFPDFPKRISYLVAPDGTIARRYEVTDVNTHPQHVLDDLQAARG